MDKPETEMKPVRISREEWFAISLALEEHHAVFYKVWQMGKPNFTEEVETAAVQFDEVGKFVYFHFNPKFWQSLDFRNKLFVICHEALHVILNHGVRTREAGRLNRAAVNSALDVVVNHSLINNFGFKREEIINHEKLCWVDTVYKGNNPLPPDNEMYEYYYNLFEKVYKNGKPGDGDPVDPEDMNKMGGMGNGEGTVDDHSFMGDKSDKWDKAIDELQESLSQDEKESIKSFVEKHFAKNPPPKGMPAGSGTGQWVFAAKNPVKKKKKWETIIKKWAKPYLINNFKEVEQWARTNRRWHALDQQGMFLPSDMEVEQSNDEVNRIEVYFFLDTSGSCWSLKERFFTAAESLPKERFDLKLLCFDTAVKETTLESRKIYGGGGTSFNILEKYIQAEIAKGGKYPHAVFVITDGYGDRVAPAYPERWYWFLTQNGYRAFIPPKSNIFDLGNFE